MGMSDTTINDFNLKIRQTPWYQEWFAARGLNPNSVQLNERQRDELKQLVEAQAGFRFPKDMKIDPAGNLNEKGGWAGLPTGVKIAIIAGATIATAGAAGAFAGGAGAASGAASGGATAATGAGAATAGGMGTLGTIAGLGGGGLTAMDIVRSAIGPTIGLATNYFANRSATNANNAAAEAQQRAADEQMKWLKELEERRRQEFELTQQRNLELYEKDFNYRREQDALMMKLREGSAALEAKIAADSEAQRAWARQQEAQRQGRLKPYQEFGANTLGQLMRPPQGATIGKLMGAA